MIITFPHLLLDMDSCILAHECIDELASEMNVCSRVSEITRRAMAGELDFNEALKERVSLLKGMKEEQMKNVWNRLTLTPGAVPLIRSLKAAGFKIALVSGGFTYFTHKVASKLGIDFAFSNTLEVDSEGKLTGNVTGAIVNGQMKAQVVKKLAKKEGVDMRQTITMGDGANDQYMVAEAGFGVAFHAKSILKAATPHHINYSPLHTLLHYIGVEMCSGLVAHDFTNVRLVEMADTQHIVNSISLDQLLSE
eukprot:TRINITY_DN6082_c0_g1_i2.p1 TRINITY_DN6082_c0_g1~~TRINITY_DN6082_c0_g1_i2.p1  ORF type:complete len:251 (-),score=45.01 TRINITY_DN6082_c0_g1_i2:11-763(-)